MFKDSDIDFMSNNMKIDVPHIESKLNELVFSDSKEMIADSINKFIQSIRSFESNGQARDLYSFSKNHAESFILKHWSETKQGIYEKSEVYAVYDVIRHAFSSYAYNGLHQLYERQENESWYPKITLTEILTPNDILTLDQEIKLYRGCDISELNNRNFGQSWSTSLEIAESFAYEHYSNSDWFDRKTRTVLKTIFSREYVFYSNQQVEFEVVVDVNHIGVVNQQT